MKLSVKFIDGLKRNDDVVVVFDFKVNRLTIFFLFQGRVMREVIFGNRKW
jgi:hypothetical protein